ncbi:glycoside hydrolase family 6 protein [Kitasatospora sp. NPDC096147]|uniref:glycoside hydrolase family 6 protein n=1 Tax=Kitasatospora sp. NPDC096147 TaxID=3364093 RepID=UPI003817B553
MATTPGPTAFYVSPFGAARRAAGQVGGPQAVALERIARSAAALWLTGADAGQLAEAQSRRAAAEGRVPLLVAYGIPNRDCGLYSAGGAADGAAYRAWIGRIAAGLGDRPAWVVLEPDAVAHAVEGCADAGADRSALLAHAVKELKKNPKVRVYLDAGNAGWVRDRAALARALERAGVGAADGFALNVSNFFPTDQSYAYGREVSAALGGKHFVIDTSRNGNGAPGGGSWCNPPGRALGQEPTTRTGREGLDALLWVKIPGESDGDCGRGEPAAGEFWLSYALGLAGAA